jgi:hypothetical protein
MSAAAGLNEGECGLTDGSVEGDWQLASGAEIQGLITYPPTTWSTVSTPPVCWTVPKAPFFNVQLNAYWSSTMYVDDLVWMLTMQTGSTSHPAKSSSYYVWPVHDAN